MVYLKKMLVELMHKNEVKDVLDYLSPYEKFSVVLYSQILHGACQVYIIRGSFREIHGVFSWWQGSSIHHCIPDASGKSFPEVKNALEAFFRERTVKYIFSIAGERSGNLLFREILESSFGKKPDVQIEYDLMENGRFDSVKNLQKMNTQLKVEVCKEKDEKKVFALQKAYEKEEVVIDGADFDEDSCRAKFENFVEANAVYIGKVSNVPLCKLTVSAAGRNYAQIGGVFVIPKYRNHGLATTLLNSVAQRLQSDGKKCVLFVKKTNTPAIKAYTCTGFKKICDFQILYY